MSESDVTAARQHTDVKVYVRFRPQNSREEKITEKAPIYQYLGTDQRTIRLRNRDVTSMKQRGDATSLEQRGDATSLEQRGDVSSSERCKK